MSLTSIAVIRINYSEFRDVEEMAARIKIEYENIANIRYVDFPASRQQ